MFWSLKPRHSPSPHPVCCLHRSLALSSGLSSFLSVPRVSDHCRGLPKGIFACASPPGHGWKDETKNRYLCCSIAIYQSGSQFKMLCLQSCMTRGEKKKTMLENPVRCNFQYPVYGRRVNSFVLVCSLSSHRHFFIPLIFGSRFIDS